MKILKKLSIPVSLVLLAGVVTFSACKKDNTPAGTKAANEMCDCASKTKESEMASCMLNWYSNYSEYFDIDFDSITNYDPESGELPFAFNNSKFEKDFYAGIAKCAASFIEDEE